MMAKKTTPKPKTESVLAFTEEGIDKFQKHIVEKRVNTKKKMPNLRTAGLVEEYEARNLKIQIPQHRISHLQLSDLLLDFFKTNGIDMKSTFGKRGLWTYLTYLFFDKHLSTSGHEPIKINHYIVEEGTWSYYRHSLTAICWIRSLHGIDVGRVLMLPGKNTEQFGDAYEQILASPIYQSKAFLQLLDDLYLHDDGKGNLSTTSTFLAQPKSPSFPLSLRKFKQAVSRLNMTYHLPSLTVGRLKSKLPEGFRIFGSIADDPLPGETKDTSVGSKKVPIP